MMVGFEDIGIGPAQTPAPQRNRSRVGARPTGPLARYRAAAHILITRARVSPAGTYVAVVFVSLSLTPSLLPRTWLIQGLISGLSATIGYATGVTAATVSRWVLPDRLRQARLSMVIQRVFAAGAVALLAFLMYRGSLWQRDLYVLMGLPPPRRPAYAGVLLVTVLLWVATIGLARGVRALCRWIGRMLGRRFPPLPARAGAIAVVALLIGAMLSGLVQEGVLSAISNTSASTNDLTGPSPNAPAAATRSGSPASLVSWDSLGLQGRSFVSGGPTIEQLRRFGGGSAQEPIRVYVGLKSAPSAAAAAILAVRELERTGAFDRSVLCVVTTTGTGWVDPYLAAALEYMHNGDTAMVGLQYSYLPSWVLLLTDRERVKQAGRELFTRVYARWSGLPQGHRPRLLVFGESLGSLGSEAAFTGLDDVQARTDGALWAGPTSANDLWSRLVVGRDPGSAAVIPVYRHGETVRFASEPADLQHPAGPWSTPRVVYLQNPSDPVTWWSPRLVWQRPDWLAESPGHDVLPAMRWYPFVTFLQVTADLALAEGAPPRHGHSFRRAAVAAWAAIAPPEGWTEARSEELTQLLDRLA